MESRLLSSAWSGAVVDEYRLLPWPDASIFVHHAFQDVYGWDGWLGHIDSLSEFSMRFRNRIHRFACRDVPPVRRQNIPKLSGRQSHMRTSWQKTT